MEYYQNAQIINSLSELPKIGDIRKYPGGKCISVAMRQEFTEENDGYVIFDVTYFDGEFIDPCIDNFKFSYAIKAENIK